MFDTPLPREITIRAKYSPAMEITDPEEARACFERLVEHNMQFGTSREEAERIERCNLGYYAGYYDHETRCRVERLYDAEHPIFGHTAPTPEQALEAGRQLAEGGGHHDE